MCQGDGASHGMPLKTELVVSYPVNSSSKYIADPLLICENLGVIRAFMDVIPGFCVKCHHNQQEALKAISKDMSIDEFLMSPADLAEVKDHILRAILFIGLL